jgi:uncharacterized membrane protein YkoI
MRNMTKFILAGAGAVVALGGVAAAATSAASAASSASAATSAAAQHPITMEQAVGIAKRKVPGAKVTEVEREREHGRQVWEVELRKGGWEYDIDVDIATGKIVDFDRDYDDDDDDDDDDD